MEKRICLKRQNYWINKDDEDRHPEYRSLEFHPDVIKEMHDALDIEIPTHDGALSGVEGSGQFNDYYIVDIGDESVAIDWQLVNLIKKLNDEGIETYGCDQGGIVPEDKCWEYPQWTYNGTDMVETIVTLESGEARYGFISFEMEHENLVVNLFSKLGLEAAC